MITQSICRSCLRAPEIPECINKCSKLKEFQGRLTTIQLMSAAAPDVQGEFSIAVSGRKGVPL